MRSTPAERSGADAVLFLRMQPSWSVVDDLRRLVESFCESACPGVDRRGQLALAVHELVQNAVANAATPDVELRLEIDRASGRVCISVSNVARAEQIAVLRERLRRTLAHRDPLAGYVAALHEAPEARGGVGLARIRYEAALELAVDVEGARVTVRAAGPLTAPPPDAAALASQGVAGAAPPA